MTTSIIIIIFILQSALIAYPLIRRKFARHTEKILTDDAELVRSFVEQAAKQALLSSRVRMSFTDEESLYVYLAKTKNTLLGKRSQHSYAYFNFPLAYLLLGLLDIYLVSLDRDLLDQIEKKCAELLDAEGNLKFQFNKIDQAVFGLLFLRMHDVTGTAQYINGGHKIYEQVLRFKASDGLYLYRLGLDVYFIDTVGLLCPFLVAFAERTGNETAMADAEKQVHFALSHCIEPRRGLAFHAFDLNRDQPLGSVNWARGMGWFLLGLSSVSSRSDDLTFHEALKRSAEVINSLREVHGHWPQFLGHTNDTTIDSSGTLMFLYAFQKCKLWSIDSEQLINLASQCVDRRGRVGESSGDTIYINKYSRVKGRSELSQGLMLSVIAGMAQ